MPTKIHQNTFQGGLNKDVDPKNLPNNQYVEAISISLTRDGKQTNPTPIKGTTSLETLLSGTGINDADMHILGSYRVRGLVNGVNKDGIAAIVYSDKLNFEEYQIYFYDIAGDAKYLLYENTIDLTNADRYVDGVVYREDGVDYLYITDFQSPIKKIPCNTGATAPDNSTPIYTDIDVTLVRGGFQGEISSFTVSSGGDLACGTYQFAYRLIHDGQNRYTKWTVITNPIPISQNVNGTDAITTEAYGGVGYLSDAEIDITLTTDGDLSSSYTHYQVAVIENLDGTEAPQLNVKILKPVTMFVTSTTYKYKTNKIAQGVVSIDELTIDDAAIEAVKTLAVKNNRLIAGNVKYHDLEYDSSGGDPAVGTTTIPIKQTFTGDRAVAYRDPNNNAKVGYFRDEVYRFGVVYEDKYGNFSKPKVLDFSGLAVGNNKATSGIDFKFPARNDGNFGPLLDATNGDIVAIGLAIKNLTNHPTWARKVHIVRVPRKKNIIYQTPLVPSILVQPAKAEGLYPTTPDDLSGGELEELNVEAANPDGSYAPKNFFHMLPKSLLRYGDFYGVIETRGGVYGTHNITSGAYQWVPAAINETLTGLDGHTIYVSDNEAGPYYRAKDVDSNVYIRMRWTSDSTPPVGFKDIVAGDALTVRVKRRAIGTTPFSTTVETLVSYASTTALSPLDLTQYDYLIEIYNNI
jgi:hypothetical protein